MATTKNITMKQFNGTDYDTLYPKTKIEQVEGAYTQQQILADSTKGLFGLDATAVPDDVLVWLAHFNSRLGDEYVWEKSHTAEQYVITGQKSTNNTSLSITNDRKYTVSDSPPGAVTQYYTDLSYYTKISVNKDTGSLSLSGQFSPTKTPTSSNKSYWSSILPFYVKTPGGNILLVTRIGSEFSDHLCFEYYLENSELQNVIIIDGYVNSSDPNAYPPAIPDGYIYMPLGRFGAKANIVTGSYVGTGAYGSSNPNSLTFDFPPKIMGVTENGSFQLGVGGADNRLSLVEAYTESFQFKNGFGINVMSHGYGRKTNGGRTIEWYSTDSATSQMNESEKIYYYFAIG